MKQLILALVMVSPAWGADIAQCGASHGYANYAKYNLSASSPDVGKWEEDGISSGQFSLTISDGGEYDILFMDTTGGIYSASNDGGKVVMTGKTENAISVVVVYPSKSVETYSFFRNADGEAKMMWTQNKYGAMIPKVAAFVGDCSYLVF